MKQTLRLATLGLALAIQITSVSANASDKKVCKVSTNDVGTIVGRGATAEAAFEDAATQCFDRREARHNMSKGGGLDEETGLVVIDSCANIRCN